MVRSLFISFTICCLVGCGSDGGQSNSRSSDGAVVGLCGESLRVTNGVACPDLYKSSIALLQIEVNGATGAHCSAALISSRTLITAAHCIDAKAGVTGVLVGFPLPDGESGQKTFEAYRALSFKAHPLWDGQAGNPYDIGIITLDRDIITRPTVPLISSGAHVAQSGDMVGIYGFGRNEFQEVGTLRYGDMVLEDLETGHAYDEKLLGASFNSTGQSICSGDSGGPAGMEVMNTFGIVGINSVGTSETCMEDSMAGFANIQLDQNINFILQEKTGTVALVGANGVEYL